MRYSLSIINLEERILPRKPRFYLPGIPAHVVQRGNNRQAIFFDDSDYVAYLTYLKEGLARYHCVVHAYVLMTNHVHLLMTPYEKDAISHLTQYVGRHYVPYINYTYERSGTLWEGRHKGSLVQDETYFLNCMRYIELNPVRANMVNSPKQYPWSSHMKNAFNVDNDLITAHDSYLCLDENINARVMSYRDLFKQTLSEEMLSEIRACWQTGTPLGNDLFLQQIEAALNVRVGRTRRGRPAKADNND